MIRGGVKIALGVGSKNEPDNNTSINTKTYVHPAR